MNMPIDKGSKSLIGVNGKINYVGERLDFGELPTALTSTSFKVQEMAYLNGNVYVLTTTTSKFDGYHWLYVYKYDGTSWIECQIAKESSSFSNFTLQINENNIY